MRWKIRSYQEWNPWFAWRPIKVNDEWVWGERILRRRTDRLEFGKRVVGWEYVNSEFDLIKSAGQKIEEQAAGQVSQGPIPSSINILQKKSDLDSKLQAIKAKPKDRYVR